jgi:hypothetical protein
MIKKLVALLVFFVVANPATFKLVRGVAGKWVSSAEGLPTTAGLLLFALIHVLVAEFVMKLVAEKKSATKDYDAVGPEYDLDEVVDYPKYISN